MVGIISEESRKGIRIIVAECFYGATPDNPKSVELTGKIKILVAPYDRIIKVGHGFKRMPKVILDAFIT